MLSRLHGWVLSGQWPRQLIAQLHPSQLIPGGSVSRINLHGFLKRLLRITPLIFFLLFEPFFESLLSRRRRERAGYANARTFDMSQAMQRNPAHINVAHETDPAVEFHSLGRKTCQFGLNLTVPQILAGLCAHTIVVPVGTTGIADGGGRTLGRIPKAKAETAVQVAIGFAVPASPANGLNHGRFSQFRSIVQDDLAGDENGRLWCRR